MKKQVIAVMVLVLGLFVTTNSFAGDFKGGSWAMAYTSPDQKTIIPSVVVFPMHSGEIFQVWVDAQNNNLGSCVVLPVYPDGTIGEAKAENQANFEIYSSRDAVWTVLCGAKTGTTDFFSIIILDKQ